MAEKPVDISNQGTVGKVLLAVRKALRPLVELMISRGITLPLLYQHLKEIYVSVAQERFAISDKKMTDSRISLITGVHRKDVSKLREQGQGQESGTEIVPDSVSIGTRLISTWMTDNRFTDSKGKPRRLSLKETNDSKPGFEALAASVSRQDLHSRVVLDELVQQGLVAIASEKWVTLEKEGYVPDKDFDDKLWFFGENLAAHAETGINNLVGSEIPKLERSVSYSGLSGKDIERINKLSADLGQRMLVEVNREARKLKQARAKSGQPGNNRFTLGVYLHQRADEDNAND